MPFLTFLSSSFFYRSKSIHPSKNKEKNKCLSVLLPGCSCDTCISRICIAHAVMWEWISTFYCGMSSTSSLEKRLCHSQILHSPRFQHSDFCIECPIMIIELIEMERFSIASSEKRIHWEWGYRWLFSVLYSLPLLIWNFPWICCKGKYCFPNKMCLWLSF